MAAKLKEFKSSPELYCFYKSKSLLKILDYILYRPPQRLQSGSSSYLYFRCGERSIRVLINKKKFTIRNTSKHKDLRLRKHGKSKFKNALINYAKDKYICKNCIHGYQYKLSGVCLKNFERKIAGVNSKH